MNKEVDYYCSVNDETYKNSVESFYTPFICLLDASFVGTQYICNITNIFGEKLILTLMKSVDIIGVIDLQGVSLVYFYFVIRPGILSNMVEHIISLLIHIVIGT